MVHSFQGVHFNNRQEFFMLLATSLQAVFIGAFISLFTIGSHVLFLQSWLPENIPQAFLISGAIGVLMFSIYSYFNSRVNFRTFALIWFLISFVGNTALYIFYDTLVQARVLGIPLMMPFSLNAPVAFLVMLLLRRTTLDVFKPFQQRRFTIITRTAFIGGIVAASYALVGALYVSWDILLILAFSSAFIGIAFILQIIINVHHRNSGAFIQPVKRTPLRSKFYEIFYTRYTLLLLTFVVLSALVGFVIHFHFVSETRFNYPDTIGLAKFFGFFTGTMFLFVYIVERFLVRKILYSYDSPYSLVLIPAVLVLAAVASLVVDLLVGQSTVICPVFLWIFNGRHAQDRI